MSWIIGLYHLSGRFTRVLGLIFMAAVFSRSAQAQESPSSDLFKQLEAKDSLLFQVGFNTCALEQFEAVVSEDFEFYHDQSGVTASKAAFIASIKEGLCKLNYQPRRYLVKGSLEVYPLKNNGALYGAIQTGWHRFYALEKDKPEYFTSIARFTHVWKLEAGNWKLVRVLSYDHRNTDTGEKEIFPCKE